jgi:hypothetical protein
MLDLTAIETALVSWIRARTGLPQSHVFKGLQNIPQPKEGKYITFLLGGLDRIGRDQRGPTDANGVREVLGQREFPVTLSAFREGARELLDSLADSLDEEAPRDALRAAGIVVWDIGNVLDLTAAQETTMVEHHAVEIFLRVADSRTEYVGFIAQVELTGTSQSANAPDHTETVTIGDPVEDSP